jgi:hypothetical protein
MNKELLSRCIESVEIAFSIVELTYRLQGSLGLNGIVQLFKDEVEVSGTLISSKELSREEAYAFLCIPKQPEESGKSIFQPPANEVR